MDWRTDRYSGHARELAEWRTAIGAELEILGKSIDDLGSKTLDDLKLLKEEIMPKVEAG